jgi:hypothetical protein
MKTPCPKFIEVTYPSGRKETLVPKNAKKYEEMRGSLVAAYGDQVIIKTDRELKNAY